jgi:predicted nucleic acid-binding protein
MKNVFLDTNILLDLLLKRKAFLHDATQLFSKADLGEIHLFMSALSFANAYYILFKGTDDKAARKELRKVETIVSIIDLNGKMIKLSLNDVDFKDFEDGLQYYAALEGKVDVIVTRNLKDFKSSTIPVMTPDAFLKL